jgi:hypothetical protein
MLWHGRFIAFAMGSINLVLCRLRSALLFDGEDISHVSLRRGLLAADFLSHPLEPQCRKTPLEHGP